MDKQNIMKGESIMEYKTIKLVNGYVKYPSDYIVIKSTKTPMSNYAGVISDLRQTINKYLVFSNKPISSFTLEEEIDLEEKVGEEYSEVMEAMLKEVDAKYKDGIWINKEEWTCSPRVVLFPIKDVTDSSNLQYETGIYRKEA